MTDVQIGQIWEDCDPRTAYKSGPRRVEIIELESAETIAVVEDTETKRLARISVRRLKPGSRGYRLVEPTP